LGAGESRTEAYLGNLPAGATRRVLLQLTIDARSRGGKIIDVVAVGRLQDGSKYQQQLEAKISVTTDAAKVAAGINHQVIAQTVALESARVQAKAAEEAAKGNLVFARQMVASNNATNAAYVSAMPAAAGMMSSSLSAGAEALSDLQNFVPDGSSVKKLKARSYRSRTSKL
jgi:hypothetical protein